MRFALAAAACLALALTGCNNNGSSTDAGNGNDSGMMGTDSGHPQPDSGMGMDSGQQDAGPPPALSLTQLASAGFSSPMATAASATGQLVYFTAFDATNDAGVWMTQAGGAVAPISVGGPFVMPAGLAISADDGTLYVADVASQVFLADGGLGNDEGALWSVAASGGTPSAIPATGITQPSVVTLSADGTSLIVSAKDSTGAPGVFKVSTAGGAATPLAQTGLNDPGEATDCCGTLWVAEQQSAAGLGAVLQYNAAGAGTDLTPFAFQYGYPGGLAATQDGSKIYAAYRDIGGAGILWLPSNGVGSGGNVQLTPSAALTEPSGLSRSHGANVFGVADQAGGGAIYTGQ